MTNEEIIERQANQITRLHKELIQLKSEKADVVECSIMYSLQEEIFQMHSKIGELYHENDELKEQLMAVLNSRTWKATQWLRDIAWKMKGNK